MIIHKINLRCQTSTQKRQLESINVDIIVIRWSKKTIFYVPSVPKLKKATLAHWSTVNMRLNNERFQIQNNSYFSTNKKKTLLFFLTRFHRKWHDTYACIDAMCINKCAWSFIVCIISFTQQVEHKPVNI